MIAIIQKGVAVIFNLNLKGKIKTIKCIEVFCYEIQTEKGNIVIFPCYDAELFSDGALRLLLLSEKAEQIIASVAISERNGDVTIKFVRL